MPALIEMIIDPKLDENSEGKEVARMVNILATNIILNADQTNMMCALLKQLHERVLFGYSETKFTEMVMKCIWKQARILQTVVSEMRIERVLLELHNFLRDFPKEFWVDKKDVPFRTVRTITYMLVQAKREDIFVPLSQIPEYRETGIYRYINRVLSDMNKGSKGNNSTNVEMRSNNTSACIESKSNISVDRMEATKENMSQRNHVSVQEIKHTPVRLPPASEMTKEDVLNWCDSTGRLIGVPDFRNNVMLNLEKRGSTFGSNDQENLMKAHQMAAETQKSVDEWKKKCGLELNTH